MMMIDNISQFVQCTFSVDDTFVSGETFAYHVSMWDVDGVDFLGCNFEDNRSITSFSSEGIYSIVATYRIKNIPCPLPPDPCGGAISSTFKGFYRAIEAANANDRLRDIEINGVDFKNNNRDVLLSAINHSLIINNTFQVIDNPGVNCYGLYLESCSNYHVENNAFTQYGSYFSGSSNAGIFVQNNSNKSTQIYRNTFQGLETGIRCQGNNSNLKIKCNTFNQPIKKYDIYVTSGVLGPQGICSTVGSLQLKVRTPAGNTFSHDCISLEADFRIASGLGLIINYSHHNEPLLITSPHVPFCFTADIASSNLVFNINCNETYNQGGYESCPSTLPLSGGIGGKMAADESIADSTGASMLANALAIQNDIETQAAKIDDGNTYNLQQAIQSVVLSESTLYAALKSASPYLSNTVLITLLQTPGKLTTYHLLDVLDSNAPLSDSVAEVLATTAYIVPAAVEEDLTNAYTLAPDGEIIVEQSDMTQLQTYLTESQAEKLNYLEQAVDYYLQEGKVDSALVVAALDGNSDNWQLQQKTEIYLNTNDFVEASQAVNAITDTAQSITDYKQLYATLITVASEGRTLNEITDEEAGILTTLGNKITPSGVAAFNALKLIHTEIHEEVFDGEEEEFFLKKPSILNDVTEQSMVKIYPNPADGIVYIELLQTLPTDATMQLKLYDLTGKLVFTKQLTTTISWIKTTELVKGIYVVKLDTGNEILTLEKLIIER